MIWGHSSAVKLRFLPGAILAAIMAASIGKVPLPQKGSTRILPAFQGVSSISAAARFSAMGAFAVSLRYPLLCKDSPVLSSPTVTSSFIRNTRTGKFSPSSGNQLISYWAFSRSTIAFFIMDWISEGLNNLDFTLAALATQNLPSFGMYSSQGRFFVPWNSSSKVSAWKLPILIRILSAVRRKIFALHKASSSPKKVTRPSATSVISYPRSVISLFNTDSIPKWQGAINSKRLIRSSGS